MQDSEHQPSDVHSLESSSKPAAALGQVQPDVHGDFKVTYQLGKSRATMIDDIDEQTAQKVVARFGNKSDPWMFMPGLRIERAASAQTTAQPDVQGDAK